MLNQFDFEVSIIIPVFNGKKFLDETILSVLNQTFRNFEVILIDHASTDSSLEIMKYHQKKDDRIKIIQLDINKGGPAYPRNEGIKASAGEYIAFLDADDVWLPEKLERQLEFIQKNRLNFSSCYCTLIDEQNQEVSLGWKSAFLYKILSKKTICDVIKYNFILTSSVIIAKEILLNFNENKNYIAVEDFDLWLRILVGQKVVYKYQDENLIQYRLVKNSISDRNNELRQELKANLVLATFLLDNEHYILCYFKRLFFYLFRKAVSLKIKKLLTR